MLYAGSHRPSTIFYIIFGSYCRPPLPRLSRPGAAEISSRISPNYSIWLGYTVAFQHNPTRFTPPLTERCRIIVADDEQREVSHKRILHMICSGSLYIRQFSTVVPAPYRSTGIYGTSISDSYTSALLTERCRGIVANEEPREASHTHILPIIRTGSHWPHQFSI